MRYSSYSRYHTRANRRDNTLMWLFIISLLLLGILAAGGVAPLTGF